MFYMPGLTAVLGYSARGHVFGTEGGGDLLEIQFSNLVRNHYYFVLWDLRGTL